MRSIFDSRIKRWKKLKSLNALPIDLKRIELIRKENRETLSIVSNIEKLIPELGLNDEGLNEFPEELHSYCGQGLRIWQYPIQFGRYLLDLSKLEIKSYLELGIRHGGTFVTTVEYLQKFCSLNYAMGVDIIPCPAMEEYQKLNPKASFLRMDTQSIEFKRLVESFKEIDLVFIDSLHEESHCRNEFESLRNVANGLAFHDIDNVEYPGIRKVWEEVKATNVYACHEYTAQYANIAESYMGIGLAIKK